MTTALAASTSASRAASTTRRAPAWLRILIVGSLLTAAAFAMVFIDPARADIWELAHWDLAAIVAALTVVASIPGTSGVGRLVRIGTLVSIGFWLAGNLTFSAMVLTDTVTVPSISDVLAILFVLPGGWLLITRAHGRLRGADEVALYLDDALAFLATAAVLLAIFGESAYRIGGLPGLMVVLYPAVFLGFAGTSIISLLAMRQPLTLGGGLGFALGVGLTGLGYASWIVPTVTGAPADRVANILFSVGPLIAAYGAAAWRDSASVEGRPAQLAALASWCVAPIAVFCTALASMALDHEDPLSQALHVMALVGVVLLVARLAFHLAERGRLVRELHELSGDNQRLIEQLQREAVERERANARLVDASRMTAVGELAAAVAHEVNNPLTGVLGYADLLLADRSLDARVRADLAVVRSEALRVRDRVRTLLDFATPRRSDLVDTDLATVVASPLALLRYHLERRNLVVVERYAELAPVRVDAAAIQQVVINIVTGVAAALPDGGTLTVATETAPDGAVIAVEAAGKHLDLAAMERIAIPFSDEGALGAVDPGAAIAPVAATSPMLATFGVLRGHQATIGLRTSGPDRARIELHLPAQQSIQA